MSIKTSSNVKDVKDRDTIITSQIIKNLVWRSHGYVYSNFRPEPHDSHVVHQWEMILLLHCHKSDYDIAALLSSAFQSGHGCAFKARINQDGDITSHFTDDKLDLCHSCLLDVDEGDILR